MYSPFKLALKYFTWWCKAFNSKGHGMHSPFVFEFITRVLNDKRTYPAYSAVENLRQELKQDQTILEVNDLGAGSVVSGGMHRSVSSIARNAAKPGKWAQLLFRIVNHYEPGRILELGTSLGISASYLSLGNEKAELITLEGSPAIAEKAKQNFVKLGLNNVHLKTGNFDELLPVLLNGDKDWDLVFVDGNHRKEPTLRYFEWVMARVNSGSIIIFDDIHWSKEMESAWEQIGRDPRVRCSLDLFYMGLVFFREEFHEKLNFSIRA